MRRARRIPFMVALLSVAAGAALMLSAAALRCAAMEEQDMSAATAPQGQATASGASPQPAASPDSNHGDDWERVPADSANAPAGSDQVNLPAPQVAPENPQPATPGEAPSATPTPEPPPALDVSSIDTGVDMASRPLNAAIKAAGTPSMAASLRVTEQARKQLAKGSIDAALRSLTEAVSIDPADPFEYYFLGRAHFERKNYQQALTFFQRAQLGFSNEPDWLGETLSYEGACDEALGHQLEAAKAYQRAVAIAPGNFRARIGYGRLSAVLAPVPSVETPLSPSDNAPPAPSAPVDGPPPVVPSAPPAE